MRSRVATGFFSAGQFSNRNRVEADYEAWTSRYEVLSSGRKSMRALTGQAFEFATLLEPSEDHRAKRRPVSLRDKLIVGLYSVAAPVVTIGWLAGLAWAAVKMVGYALS